MVIHSNRKLALRFLALGIFTASISSYLFAAERVSIKDSVATISNTDNAISNGISTKLLKPIEIDFANLQNLPLPIIDRSLNPNNNNGGAFPASSTPVVYPGAAGGMDGGLGDGSLDVIDLFAEDDDGGDGVVFSNGSSSSSSSSSSDDSASITTSIGDGEVTSQSFGTNDHPFSATKVDGFVKDLTRSYPYRATGKLLFQVDSQFFVCSASLIRPGIVVTAAHCVAAFGNKRFYSNFLYVPAYKNGIAPYGVWTYDSAVITEGYYNGTSSCAVSGIVCEDDVALIMLKPQNKRYAGHRTGWLGFAYNGYGYSNRYPYFTHVTQLGYPVSHDGGQEMQRNDSHGYLDPFFTNNTVIGSAMEGGSSGGPWTVNFTTGFARPSNTIGALNADPNRVVGVTSWGFVDSSPKQQGASLFTSNNILRLYQSVCPNSPGC